jgi:hypothetical protein
MFVLMLASILVAAPLHAVGLPDTGVLGFDYTKVANNGGDLDDGANLAVDPNEWACTRDNATGLTWEVKNTIYRDLHDWSNAFTWLSSDVTTNGGFSGDFGAGTCNETLASCNSEAFIVAVNSVTLCGRYDWRLPTERELLTLVDVAALNPSIAPVYFPNTMAGIYWSAATFVLDPSFAWGVDFADGITNAGSKTNTYSVRLVSGPKF